LVCNRELMQGISGYAKSILSRIFKKLTSFRKGKT
jgi:hypothetical protein